MNINHSDAIMLETQVRNVYKCGRFGVSGLADADNFEHDPYSAAIMIVSFLYATGKETDDSKFTPFLDKYHTIFKYPDENDALGKVSEYIEELDAIISQYK